MKAKIFMKIVCFICIGFFYLEANDSFSLELKEKIDNNMSKSLEKKFNAYNKKTIKQKKVMIDTLAFMELYKKNKSFIKKKKRANKLLSFY